MADGEGERGGMGWDVKLLRKSIGNGSLQFQCSVGADAPDVGLDFIAVARVGVSISVFLSTNFDGSRVRR